MTTIYKQRMSAEIEGDFVVLIIGMRINRFWKFNQWLPVANAMPRMIRELLENKDSGLMGVYPHFGFPVITVVQYWRSFEHLEAYARGKDQQHFPAWVAFNKRVGSNGDVGIWHETYLIEDGNYETVYNNMPAHGLGAASRLVPATGRRESARGRLSQKVESA
jgi:hypothetical protein